MKKKIQQIERHLEFAPEPLETRRMLAGSVEATVAGGSLTLSGDGQDNFIAITQFNDQLVVIGINTGISDPTFSDSFLGIDFDIKLIDGVTKDVNIYLRGGDDVVLMGGSLQGEIPENDGPGGDFSIESLKLARDLKIWTAGGRDAVVVTGTEVGRNLFIDTGFGLEDRVVVGGGGVAIAALELISDFSFDDLLVGFENTLNGLGDDPGDVLIDIVNVLFGEVTVGRDLTISGESSDDTIFVGGVHVERNARINTNIGEDRIYFGVGAAVEVSMPTWDDGEEIGLLGGMLLDEFEIAGHVTVGRRATINAGDGDDITRIGGAVAFSIEIPDIDPSLNGGGNGGDVYFFEMSGGVDVGRDFLVTAGNNDDSTYIAVQPVLFNEVCDNPDAALGDHGDKSNVSVGRNMRIDMMGDDDFLKIGGLEGELDDFDDGWEWGGPQFFLERALQVEGNLTILTGPGTDEVLMGLQEPIIIWYDDFDAQENGDEYAAYQIDVGKNLVLSTGWHDDIVSIAGYAYLFEYADGGFGTGGDNGDSVGTLRVGMNMRVNTDGGNDRFEMGHTSQEDPDGRTGVLSDSSAISIGRDLRIVTGDQDDQVTVDATTVGDDVTINTGWGRDTIDIGSQAELTWDEGDDGPSVFIGDRLTVLTSLERDTINITNTWIGGTARLQTGLRDDTVSLQNVEIGEDLLVFTDRGFDDVSIENVTVGDQIRVETGGEADEVNIFNVTAARLDLKTGDDNDLACVFDSSFFDGAELDGGEGDADALSHNLSSPVIVGFEIPADCFDD